MLQQGFIELVNENRLAGIATNSGTDRNALREALTQLRARE